MPVQTHVEVLVTIAGAALCLGGWLIFYFGSRLVGLGLGLGLGFVFGGLLSLLLELKGTHQDAVVLACSIVGAFGGLLLIRVVSSFVFFLMGFLFGSLIGRVGAAAWAASHGAEFAYDSTTITVILVSATLVALLAVWLQKYVMIVITSFVGANFLVSGVAYLRQMPLAAFIAVFVLAMLWQVVLVTSLVKGGRRPPADDGA